MSPQSKKCSGCGKIKPASEFHRMTKSPTGLQGYCKVCMKKRSTPEVRARRHRQRKYGLSQELYEEMVDRQGGRCLICRRKRPLTVDHDHDSGEVRGLLCDRCNVGVGCLDDNPVLLVRAAKYLLR